LQACQALQIVGQPKLGCSEVDQLMTRLKDEFKKKELQFSTLFQILTHGHPMCNYKREQYLLMHLKLRNLPKKHWLKSTGWEMNKHSYMIVLTTLKNVV